MEITVTINAPDLSTAITNLAEALHGFYTREEEKPATIVEVPKTAPEPKTEAPKTTSVEEKKPAAPPKAKEPTVALEDVRAALAALSQSGKQAKAKELIAKFGCKKLTEVPEEHYAELLADAEAIA